MNFWGDKIDVRMNSREFIYFNLNIFLGEINQNLTTKNNGCIHIHTVKIRGNRRFLILNILSKAARKYVILNFFYYKIREFLLQRNFYMETYVWVYSGSDDYPQTTTQTKFNKTIYFTKISQNFHGIEHKHQ